MKSLLYEKVQLNLPDCLLMEWDGRFVLKSLRRITKQEQLLNNYIVPNDFKLQQTLSQNITKMIQKRQAKLEKGYVITPHFQCIPMTPRIKQQFQRGGYNIRRGIAKKRKRSLEEEERNQRPRLEEFGDVFDLVNVRYRIYFIMHLTNRQVPRSQYGLLNNIRRLDVHQALEDLAEDFIQKQSYETIVTNIEHQIVEIPQHQVPLMQQRMYGTAVNYHYLPVASNATDNRDCVYQFLLQHYGTKIKNLTKDALLDIFDELDETTGVSTDQILNFCERYNISLYALDLDFKVFYKYVSEKRNHKLTPLMYVVGNAHMYPVLEKTVRHSIVNSVKNKIVCFQSNYERKSFDTSKEIILNPPFEQLQELENVNVIYTNRDSLQELVEFLFQSEKTIYSTKSHNGNILYLEYKNGVEIYINQDYASVTKDCQSLCIPFKNQNGASLSKELLQIYIKDTRIHSTFNTLTRNIFFQQNKQPFIHTFYEPEEDGKLTAVDIQKCYTACFSNKNKYPWCVFTALDEITDYSGVVRDGMYYLETDNYFPLKGNGWYFRWMVEYAQSLGINMKIRYELIPTYTLPKDFFNDLVDRVYTHCKDPKMIMNMMIGCLNKKTKKTFKDKFTGDLNDAIRYFFNQDKAAFFNACPDLYQISWKTETELYENTIPLYWQVVDNCCVLVHQLAMKMGGQVVKVKTDCVTVENGIDVEYQVGIRHEDVSSQFTQSSPFRNDYSFTLEPLQWNDEYTGFERLLCGKQGTGKSFQIKQDIKHLCKYALLGTTNIAARLIGGETIHSFFHIDIKGKYDKNYVLKKCRLYDYIIIDEVGMMQGYLYEFMNFLKKYSTVKFILVGDFYQLPPVEKIKHDYPNSTVLKELVNCNIQLLNENKRSNDELWELYDKVDELQPCDFNETSTKRHLCMTNRMRIKVNQDMMELDKRKKKKMLFIEKNALDKNSQDVRLLKGTPVMAIRNNKPAGFVNGMTFTVKSIEPLVLKDTHFEGEITITKEMFQSHFYVAYCTTVHKAQGMTIKEPYTIHEWSQMETTFRYTAIGRASDKSLISVVDDFDQNDLPDTDNQQLSRRKKRMERMKDPLYKKRMKGMTIINRIVRDSSTSDETCLKHTFKTRQQLLEHLKIPSGRVPRGYEIDHIRPRRDHITDQDFEELNAWWNLRLLPRYDNNLRNRK